MNRRLAAILITLGVIAVVLAVVAAVAGTDLYDWASHRLGKASSGRLGISKIEAHADAGSQRQSLCANCHGSMVTSKTPWHAMHLKMTFVRFECATCHKRISDEPRGIKGKVLIDRSVCPRCHGQKFPAFNEEHQKSTWQQRHRLLRGEKTAGADIYPMSMLIKKYPRCFICHRNKELAFCAKCHEYHPHTSEWVNGEHGKRAIKSDFSCLRCHDKTTWCSTQCHKGVTLPHNIPKWARHYAKDKVSPQWLRSHPYVADSFGIRETADFRAVDPQPVCSMCHNKDGASANFCQRCHHREFDRENSQQNAAWKPQHPQVVKDAGSSRCQRCHLLEFCAYCHTHGKKPQRGIFLNRLQQAVPTQIQ